MALATTPSRLTEILNGLKSRYQQKLDDLVDNPLEQSFTLDPSDIVRLIKESAEKRRVMDNFSNAELELLQNLKPLEVGYELP